MSKFQKDYTQGSVVKQLISFSLPFLFSNLLQALYSVVDMVVVGQYVGPVGVSGVQIGGQVTMLITNIVTGFVVGATVLIAQYQGAKNTDGQIRTISTLFTFFAFVSVGLTVIMALLNAPVLRMLGTDDISFGEAYNYLLCCSFGYIFIFGYNAVSGILRGMGDSKRPLWFVAIATVTNIVLDIVFVKYMGMRSLGAALATVIAQGLSFLLSMIYLKRSDFIFDFKLKSFKIYKDKLNLIFKIGCPSAVQFSITGLSFLALTGISNAIAGTVGTTLLGIGQKLNTFGILPCIALSSSISSMAGQNIGAKKYDRAKKTMWVGMGFALALSVVVFGLVNLFPNQIMGIFLNKDSLSGTDLELYDQCMELGAKYISLCSFDYLFACFFFCTNGLATGSGHTMFSLINSAINAFLFRVPMAYVFSMSWGFNMGVTGIAAALGFAPIVSAVIGIIYVQTGRWKKSKIAVTEG